MYGFSSLSTKDRKDVDLEAGNGETLYPGLSLGENQLRWGLIRKVYGILAVQLVLTTIVSAFTVLYTPVNALLGDSPGLLLLLCIVPFIRTFIIQISYFPLHIFVFRIEFYYVFCRQGEWIFSIYLFICCWKIEFCPFNNFLI